MRHKTRASKVCAFILNYAVLGWFTSLLQNVHWSMFFIAVWSHISHLHSVQHVHDVTYTVIGYTMCMKPTATVEQPWSSG